MEIRSVTVCKEQECGKPKRKRGWCESHYNLIWRRGLKQRKFERIHQSVSIEERLKLKSKLNVDTGCLDWLVPHNATGYGFVRHNGKNRGAHVVSWELANNASASGFVIMHTCDNRKCINPDHLVCGNDTLNMQDKVSKNRQAKGTDFKSSKLNEQKIIEIIEKYMSGMSQLEISKLFGVDASHISNIVNRKVWKHVEILQ